MNLSVVPFSDGLNEWVNLETSGIEPSPRSGHDVVIIGRKAYLFGGCGGLKNDITCLNDIFSFDLDLYRWESIAVSGWEPLPRASFGMCVVPNSDSIYIAGGTGVEVDSLRSDVIEFNTKTHKWSIVLKDSAQTPCRFYGQSICAYGDCLLLFGGSTGLQYTNDLYQYDVPRHKWSTLMTKGRKPSPRYKHQAVVVGTSLYVMGGGCFKPEKTNIDVHRLDLVSLEWEEIETRGSIPKSRVAHTCNYDPESRVIYMWGGFTTELNRLQDFYAFHCDTNTWQSLNARKECLFEAPTHASISTGDLYPEARAFHASVFHEGSLYIFSGANGDIRYSDVWRFRTVVSPPTLEMLAARVVQNRKEYFAHVDIRALPFELTSGMLQSSRHANHLT